MKKTAARAAEEIELDTERGRIAGIRWPLEGAPKVLCHHGWLDNAASFAPLGACLGQLDVVAMDFAGHGRSYHHLPEAPYYFTEYLWDIDAALDELGWHGCHLIGHSMGAAAASMYAAAAPERIRSLTLLDALGPVSEPPAKLGGRLRKSLQSIRNGPRPRKPYDSLDDMVKARRANSDLPEEAARLICERSAQQEGDHFEWTYDPSLQWVSPVLLTEEQALAYLATIEAPVLSITATPFAPFITQAKYEARTRAIPGGHHELWPGHHHLHMDQAPKVAARVQSFILEHEAKSGTTK